VKLARAVRKELAKQAAQPDPDPFGQWLARKAAHGDRAAGELLDRFAGAPTWQVHEDARRVAKGSQSGEMRRLAEGVLEDLETEAVAEHLRRKGWRG
jgi:hypothetical protein